MMSSRPRDKSRRQYNLICIANDVLYYSYYYRYYYYYYYYTAPMRLMRKKHSFAIAVCIYYYNTEWKWNKCTRMIYFLVRWLSGGSGEKNCTVYCEEKNERLGKYNIIDDEIFRMVVFFFFLFRLLLCIARASWCAKWLTFVNV